MWITKQFYVKFLFLVSISKHSLSFQLKRGKSPCHAATYLKGLDNSICYMKLKKKKKCGMRFWSCLTRNTFYEFISFLNSIDHKLFLDRDIAHEAGKSFQALQITDANKENILF